MHDSFMTIKRRKELTLKIEDTRLTGVKIGIPDPQGFSSGQMHETFKSRLKMNSVQNLRAWSRVTIALLILLPSAVWAGDHEKISIWMIVHSDVCRFCERDRLLRMGCVLGGCGLVANTSFDRNLQNWYQDDVRSSGSDEWAEIARVFGEGPYLVPVSLAAAVMGYVFETPQAVSHIGRWGQLTARAYLMGGPVVLGMQRLTGGSRPGETNQDSDWRHLKDDNGVSGHSFIGAVPFLTIAHMNHDHAAMKYAFFLLSALPAWSRINDNKHYPSQAIAGWYLAWEATDAVFDSRDEEKHVTISPLIGHGLCGASVDLGW